MNNNNHNNNNKGRHQQQHSHGHIPQQSSGQFIFDQQNIQNANNPINPSHIVNITNSNVNNNQTHIGHVDDMKQSQQPQQQQPSHHTMNSLSTIQIPKNLQNTQLTPEQVFALYQQQNNQVSATSNKMNVNNSANPNPKQIVYHVQHDNFYKITVGTPQNVYPQTAQPYAIINNNNNNNNNSVQNQNQNQNPNPNPNQNQNQQQKRTRKHHAQSLPNHRMDQAAKQYMYSKRQQPVMANIDDDYKTNPNNPNFKDDSSNDSNKSSSTRITHTTHSKSQSMTQSHLYGRQSTDVLFNQFVRQQSPVPLTAPQFQQMISKTHSNNQSLRSVISNNSQQSHTTQHTKRTLSSDHEHDQGQESYLSLSNHNSVTSSKENQGNTLTQQHQELPSFSDRYESGKTTNTQNTDNSGDSDKDNLLRANKNNLNLRIAVANDHPDLPMGLPNNPSSRVYQQQPIHQRIHYDLSGQGSRTPIPQTNISSSINISPHNNQHARSVSLSAFRSKKQQAQQLQQQYQQFNQLSPINVHQAQRTIARNVAHNRNKHGGGHQSAYSDVIHGVHTIINDSGNITPVGSDHSGFHSQQPSFNMNLSRSFGLQTIEEDTTVHQSTNPMAGYAHQYQQMQQTNHNNNQINNNQINNNSHSRSQSYQSSSHHSQHSGGVSHMSQYSHNSAQSMSSPYTVNGVAMGLDGKPQFPARMISHSQTDSSLSSISYPTPKVTPSGTTVGGQSSFFSPSSASHTTMTFDENYEYAQSLQSGFQSPASPFNMQTLYEDATKTNQQEQIHKAIAMGQQPQIQQAYNINIQQVNFDRVQQVSNSNNNNNNNEASSAQSIDDRQVEAPTNSQQQVAQIIIDAPPTTSASMLLVNDNDLGPDAVPIPALPTIPSSEQAAFSMSDDYGIKQIQVTTGNMNNTSIHHNRSGTPINFKRDPYHAKNNSLNIAQNNLIRSKLLDAQAWMDSNASGASQWSALSGMSGRTGHSSRPSDEIFTLGFINTEGQQVRSLIEYLQSVIKEAFLLDLNAVPSRSSSMASIKALSRHNSNSRKRASQMAIRKEYVADDDDDKGLNGYVFTGVGHDVQASDTLSAAGTPLELVNVYTNTPMGTGGSSPLKLNDQLSNISNTSFNHPIHLATFSSQVNSFKNSGVAIIDENKPEQPTTTTTTSPQPIQIKDDSEEKASLEATNSKSHTHSSSGKKSHNSNISCTPLSPKTSERNLRVIHQSVGSIHGSFAAPHNDLDALVIFEPVKTFEILDLHRGTVKEQSFKTLRNSFEKTLQAAFTGCVKYLKHRIKHTISQIRFVFFVTFAMRNPAEDVSQIWYELCQIRMKQISQTVTQCQKLCEESRMKFFSCITPIDPASFSNNTPSSGDGNIYKDKDDVLANYHFPNYSTYQEYLPFKNRIELSQHIRKTLKPQLKFENASNRTISSTNR